jgi:uncharacterized caspase-like protein
MSIAVGINSDVLTEPMLFQILFSQRPDNYAAKTQPLNHAVELREITRVELSYCEQPFARVSRSD